MAKELLNKVKDLGNKHLFSGMLDALAFGVKQSNVKVIYNYPGRPATLLLEKVRELYPEIDAQDYLPNEFVATAKGFGSSVAGCERSLVLFKDVGTNVACDHFYCLNHIGINRGLVFFISDDPSAWASQNEEDSRGIYFNAGLPIFEPHDPYSAYYSILASYELSEMYRLPFFIRTTGNALKESFNPDKNTFNDLSIPFVKDFIDIPFDALDRWKSIFSTVEEDKDELYEKQKNISKCFETIGLNTVKGSDSLGVIASGFPASQLEIENLVEGVSLLKLVTVYPLPEETIMKFLADKERILIVEQGEPLLEMLIRDCAQRHGYAKPISGRINNFVRKTGEFRDDDLKLSIEAFKKNKPISVFPKHKLIAKAKEFKSDDGYRIMLDTLRKAVKTVGCRPLYCGDAGQPSQIADTPGYEDLLHMETTMGCAVSYLSGAVESYKRANLKIPFKGIAYVGDSDFYHSAFPGICEAISKDHPILMLLVDNGGAVSTGNQPHIGMNINKDIKVISIKKLLETMNLSFLEEASIKDKKDLLTKLIQGLKHDKFAVLIVRTM